MVEIAASCFTYVFVLNNCLPVYMQMPVHTIASNAGVEGAVVVGKLLEQDDPDLGYDAAKGGSICFFIPFIFRIIIYNQYSIMGKSLSTLLICRWICGYGEKRNHWPAESD